jgi:YfiH family protein
MMTTSESRIEEAPDIPLLRPEWPVPDGIHAAVTTRDGGVSKGAFGSLNLAEHVGDEPGAVAENRARLATRLAVPVEPAWLEQVHGTTVVAAERGPGQSGDAAVAREPEAVCAVLTADCLPVLFCHPDSGIVAAAHAGWRGLADGVLAETVAAMAAPPTEILAWLGPAIGPDAFAVGPEVREAFEARDPEAAAAFVAGEDRDSPLFADIYHLARLDLRRVGVTAVYGGGHCTVTEADRFFSYRRDEGVTGRMATLIWSGIV